MAVGAQRVPMPPEVRQERLAVSRAAGRVPDAVHVQLHAAQTPCLQQMVEQRHDLGIHGRARRADRFHVHLVELAEAARLGPLVPEHRADQVQLHQAALGGQVVLGERPHQRGGGFGTQRQAFAPAVLEGVHLLLDDIGRLADPADEQLRPLEDGGANLGIAVPIQHVTRHRLQRLPFPRLVGKNVRSPSNALDHVHLGCERSAISSQRCSATVFSFFSLAWHLLTPEFSRCSFGRCRRTPLRPRLLKKVQLQGGKRWAE